MRFIETHAFTRQLRGLLTDEEYRRLQFALIENPELGVPIKGAGRLRKFRWTAQRRGKRGGVRVIYAWFSQDGIVYMLSVFAKSAHEDLTRQQLAVLDKLVRESLG